MPEENCGYCGLKNFDVSLEAVAALIDQIPISPSMRADAEVYEERLAACSTCDALKEGVLCGHCGCFIRFRARARTSSCPHPGGERWPVRT